MQYCVSVCVCLKVQSLLKPFRLSDEKLQDVSSCLREDLLLGLGRQTHRNAAVKMLPTFVRATPDGTGETGSVLNLNLNLNSN